MSYIHQALKRAQREQDDNYQKYKAILSLRRKNKSSLQRRPILLIVLILACIFLSLAVYSWREFKVPHPVATPESTRDGHGEVVPSKPTVSAEELYERARRIHKTGNLQEARQLYEETLRTDPGHVEALNNLGVINIFEQNFHEAYNNFKKAIRLRPRYVDSYYNLACLHAIRGEIPESLAHFRKSVSLDNCVLDWARTDADLENLHGVPEFEEMVNHRKIEKIVD